MQVQAYDLQLSSWTAEIFCLSRLSHQAYLRHNVVRMSPRKGCLVTRTASCFRLDDTSKVIYWMKSHYHNIVKLDLLQLTNLTSGLAMLRSMREIEQISLYTKCCHFFAHDWGYVYGCINAGLCQDGLVSFMRLVTALWWPYLSVCRRLYK